MRTISKNNFNSTYKFRNDKFKIGNIILIFDFITVINVLISKKLNYRWTRSYRITKSDPLKETYRISELNDAVLRDTYADNKLKHFHVTMIFDVFNRYKTPVFFGGKNNIVNFADAF